MRIDPSDAPTSRFFQPVIIHATLDAQDGRAIGRRFHFSRKSDNQPCGLLRSTPPLGAVRSMDEPIPWDIKVPIPGKS
jgi:hypothetical protein